MRFEILADDFATVCAALDISPVACHDTIVHRGALFQYYDDSFRELVRARFAAEIRAFGYMFEAANKGYNFPSVTYSPSGWRTSPVSQSPSRPCSRTILCDHPPPGALSKHREIFFVTEQPVLRQLWDVVLTVVHCFRAGNVVWQISERVSKNFGAQDLIGIHI